VVAPETVPLRRSWPQRFLLVACVAVVAGALTGAVLVRESYASLGEIGRVEVSRAVLSPDTPVGEPVNFLIIGSDSAARLDPGDSATVNRTENEQLADSISILRVDPRSGQAWVLSLPRDLYVPVPGLGRSQRINKIHDIDPNRPELLLESIRELTGIEINHYISLDFLAFREVVDQLDGVPVWFEHPTRSIATGLNVTEPGCRILDGEDALRYVRVRSDYEELIDGTWQARQQDFMVLAIDRAVQKGARSPQTMLSLLEAGAESVIFDDSLTVGELASLGESFTTFDSENLARYTPIIEPFWQGDDYIGEVLPEAAEAENDAIFSIFRGEASGLEPAAVPLDVWGSDPERLDDEAGVLANSIGFPVVSTSALAEPTDESVIIYPPGQRGDAVLVAQRLMPTPALVEDSSVDRITLVMGTEHEQVLWLFPTELDVTLDDIAERDDVGAPELVAAEPPVTAESLPATAESLPVTAAPSTTAAAAAPSTVAEPESEAGGVIGRAPEGQSCL